MADLILHHYDISNYSEKVRLALGYKSLAWHSVTIPSVAPKPELQQLTGGYRRAPVLQIGADIYCDTQLIPRALERLRPEPTLYPRPYEALAETVSHWAETKLFRPIALYVSGKNPEAFPLSLQADRARMRGLPPPSAEAMRRAAERNAPLVRAQLPLIEEMLSDGRQWILGPLTTIADFSIYHAVWFITGSSNRLAFELEPFEGIGSWMRRMAAFGHGASQPMTSRKALEIAAASNPRPVGPSHPFDEDPPLGTRVRVRAADYGKEAVEGTLVKIGPQVITVSRDDATLGEIYVHFPRLGYELRDIG
jgi:glutathione S-transferase